MIEVLTKAYLEPHRHYHTLEHIIYMFNKAKEWEWQPSDELIYAIWFHDAVYEPGAKDNEEKSIKMLMDVVSIPAGSKGWFVGSNDHIVRARAMILDTKTHIPTIEESKQLIDLDLAILGEDEIIDINSIDGFSLEGYFSSYKYSLRGFGFYDKYLTNVRREYSHVSDKDWAKGRSDWIKSMLSREQIFYTEDGKKLEAQARNNLKMELKLYD